MDGLISGLFWWILVMGISWVFWSILILIDKRRNH